MKNNSSGPLAGRKLRVVLPIAAVVVGAAYFMSRPDGATPAPAADPAKATSRPALTVSLTSPQKLDWPLVLPANGNVVAWQEAVIGAEIANYRITEVRVQVGDKVKKGQVLARIASDTVASEQAEAQASVAELEASAAEAKGNAERAKELKEKGFYSSQLNTQYQTAQNTAQARLAAARARQQAADLKMAKTGVLAPDDGVISARSATVGSLTQNGQELFRLIRGGRLEWRAEVPSADLGKVKAGVVAVLTAPGGETVKGTVRAVSPSVDPQTRNGLVYVDLPATSAVRAGMFARGEFALAQSPALTLPQGAVVLREGFAYVFRMEGEDRVAQAKVELGRRVGERVEIVAGLAPEARVVATGAGFLADGDVVKVVDGISK
ncbi:efflux RND transporter periplasmic adaptor subunit [Ferribacterium limneticum]|uniref:efflux RND transporter periplasmic adaptor subunit n=1 Tax=Ferribacterium limneticum TaxID=76259 RepID=UPI001CFBCA9C|nr:efflux RND transporter periplasmic adaptor subunit [Ferribacterium limneticum]UCV19421.1 efflux RND transporter periplasmic adaptor subunit [Ferribacterium limneticum]